MSNILFFFNDTATTEIYTLSLHDALPICLLDDPETLIPIHAVRELLEVAARTTGTQDRKSTRLNSSHSQISYAVFCLKKKRARHSTGSARRCSTHLAEQLNSGTIQSRS